MSIDFTIRPGPGNEAPIFHSKFGGHLYYWIMSSEPSIIGLLAEQAEKFYEKKDWTRAVQKFEAYFQKAYPEMDKGDQEMSLEDTRRLMRYADALFQMVQNQARENNKFDEDELDTVLLYVRSAQKTFEKYKDQVNAQEVTDTHRLLAEIARCNYNLRSSEKQFFKAYEIACEGKLSWRERLSLLFEAALTEEMRQMPGRAVRTLQDCIKLADEELAKELPAADAEDLKSFKAEFEKKHEDLKAKAPEKPEESADEGEGGEEEEEEEEEEAAE